MKARESGMPEEGLWQSFFEAECVVQKLECAKHGNESIAEFGSGYGTFTLPVARRTSGIVHAFDIDPEMVDLVNRKARREGLANVQTQMRDFVQHGTGLPSESIDHAMIFNLLHLENPVGLLNEAYRILQPRGTVSIIHWKYDPSTPRGPSLEFRPKPEQIIAWADQAGLAPSTEMIDLPPWHFGLSFKRRQVIE